MMQSGGVLFSLPLAERDGVGANTHTAHPHSELVELRGQQQANLVLRHPELIEGS